MKTILKATALTAAGALLALPAMAQGGNYRGSFNGPQQGYQSGQYMGPSENGPQAGQHGQMTYGENNGWQRSGPAGNDGNHGSRSFRDNARNNQADNAFGQNGRQEFRGMGPGNAGNYQSGQNNGGNGQGTWQSGENSRGNWRSGQGSRRSEQNGHNGGLVRYRNGFENGFEAGFTAGYRAGFGKAGRKHLASRNTSGPGMSNGGMSGSQNATSTASGSTGNASQNASNSNSSGNAGTQLSETQIRNQLEQSGYTNVHNLQKSGNEFTAEADMNGQAKQLTVDAKTGNVIHASDGSSNG